MRPTSTISGVCVVSARYPKIARPNPNAIGTPAKTQKPATPTNFRIPGPRQPQKRKQRHQAGADRQCGGAPDVWNLQRRRGDKTLLIGVFTGRPGDQQQKRQRGGGRDHVEIGPHRRARAGDDGGHAHVLGPAERHRRSQHRQPQEQDRRQLVRPDQRTVQAVTRHHARKQDDDLGDDQKGCRDFNQHAEQGLERGRTRTAARGHRLAGRRRYRAFGVSHHRALTVPWAARYDSLPTDFSSKAQASSPYLPFHSE
jgi:hypothetical protein